MARTKLWSLSCSAALSLMPACAIALSDRNEPAPNGAITGPSADCREISILPRGAPGGEASPKFVGRFATTNDAPGEWTFDWSGSYVTVRFRGTSWVTAKLRLTGAVPVDQVVTFVVDGRPERRLLTVKRDANGQPTLEPQDVYDVTGFDPKTPHELTIYKDTEAQKGPIVFSGFDLHGGTVLPPTRRKRRIEFIGDSVTCGYGNEGRNATCPFDTKVRDVIVPGRNGAPPHAEAIFVPLTENQYLSFAAIAARELDADAVTVCFSGKGVLFNYREKFKTDPNDETKWLFASEDGAPSRRVLDDDARTTMPEYWEKRTLATDAQGSAWSFSSEAPDEVPQVVFISLGTNDFARDTKEPSPDPTKPEGNGEPDGDLANDAARETFFVTYLRLVERVRSVRPDAHIIVATPPMVSDTFPLPNARTLLRAVLQRIVDARSRAGDAKVYMMDLVEQGFRYGLGCDYHPNLAVHRIMATQLVGAIRSKTCW